MNSIEDFIMTVLYDIPEKSLTVPEEYLCSKLHELLANKPVRAELANVDPFDDVSYAPYKVDGRKWEAVCVQDFDMKDYESEWFLCDICPCGDIWLDAVKIGRTKVYARLDVDMSTADSITCGIVEEICKYLEV